MIQNDTSQRLDDSTGFGFPQATTFTDEKIVCLEKWKVAGKLRRDFFARSKLQRCLPKHAVCMGALRGHPPSCQAMALITNAKQAIRKSGPVETGLT